MDAHRFDSLARALGAGSSRRGLARVFGGLALGGGIVAHGAERAEAKKKKNKNKKKDKKKQKKCQKHCQSSICCDGTCVDVITDRNNCGACGNVCGAGQYCFNTQCTPCENPLALCTIAGQEQCVNLQTDRDNCGSCGNLCPRSPTEPRRDFYCEAGQCKCSGVVCANGTCCPSDFNVCVAGGAGCCPTNYHSCNDGRCCPNGFTCGGNCGSECCP